MTATFNANHAARVMYTLLALNPGITETELAEAYAQEEDAPEWLDISDHDVFDVAYKVMAAYPNRVSHKGLQYLWNANIL